MEKKDDLLLNNTHKSNTTLKNIVTGIKMNIISVINREKFLKPGMKVIGTEHEISSIISDIIMIGGQEVQKVRLVNNNQILIDPCTAEQINLKVKGTDNKILDIGEYVIIGEKGEEIRWALVSGIFDGILIDSITLKQVHLKVKGGTFDEIIDIGDKSIIWGQEIQQVFTRGEGEILIDTKTMQKACLKVRGIDGEIIGIGRGYRTGKLIVQEMMERKKILGCPEYLRLVNLETREVIKINDMYVIEISHMYGNRYEFITDFYQKRYVVDIEKQININS